jgi:hypothetical protein
MYNQMCCDAIEIQLSPHESYTAINYLHQCWSLLTSNSYGRKYVIYCDATSDVKLGKEK